MVLRRSTSLLLAASLLCAACAQKCSLKVTVVSGQISCDADSDCGGFFGSTGSQGDGYVEASLGSTTLKTSTIDNNDQPQWNEVLDFGCPYDDGAKDSSHLVLTLYDDDTFLGVGGSDKLLTCDLGTAWTSANAGQTSTCSGNDNTVRYQLSFDYEAAPAPTPAPVAPEPQPTPKPVAAQPTQQPQQQQQTSQPTQAKPVQSTPQPQQQPTQQQPTPATTPAPTPAGGSTDSTDLILAVMSFGGADCSASGIQVMADSTAAALSSYVDGQGGCGAGFNAVEGASCGSVASYSWAFKTPSSSGGDGTSSFTASTSEYCGLGGKRRRLGALSSGAGAHRELLSSGSGSVSWSEGTLLCNNGKTFVALVKGVAASGFAETVYTVTYASKDSQGYDAAVKGKPMVQGSFCGLDFTTLMNKVLDLGADAVISKDGVQYTSSSDSSNSKSGGGFSFTQGNNLIIVVGAAVGAALIASCVAYRVRKNSHNKRRQAQATANAAGTTVDARGFYGGKPAPGTAANGQQRPPSYSQASSKAVTPLDESPVHAVVRSGAAAPAFGSERPALPPRPAGPPSARSLRAAPVPVAMVHPTDRWESESEHSSSEGEEGSGSEAELSGEEHADMLRGAWVQQPPNVRAPTPSSAAAAAHHRRASSSTQEQLEQAAAAAAQMRAAGNFRASPSAATPSRARVGTPSATLDSSTGPGAAAASSSSRYHSGRGGDQPVYASSAAASVNNHNNNNNNGHYESSVGDSFWAEEEEQDSPYESGTLTPEEGYSGESGESAESSPVVRPTQRKGRSAMDSLRAFP